MEVEELFAYRNNLLEEAKGTGGFISQFAVLEAILPHMFDAKLVDAAECEDSYFISIDKKVKLNAYTISETAERLQLFIVAEDTIDESLAVEDILVSHKSEYEVQLKRAIRFFNESVSGKLFEQTQESTPGRALMSKIASTQGIEQFDVIEVFLISLTATVSFKGETPQSRNMHFKSIDKKISYSGQSEKKEKTVSILQRVIDLNFLANAVISRGNREPLVVNFAKSFDYKIAAIKAADQSNFSSYLCVLEAKVLADLYRLYGSRLLEKNVRSFLQFKGVNRGIKETIKNEPAKFIAFNNGLTITATAIKAAVDKKSKALMIESLDDFQIVNGGQTTASIYFSQKEGLDISKVQVMAKINVAKITAGQASNQEKELDELISKISKFSNTQSRVSSVDLNARSPQLVILKNLSESVMMPSGSKWFFERAKGEFNTKVRIATNANKIKNEYPPQRRFTKEQLAKYFSAWGDIPYLVKKGGEKIFRHFIEQISPDEDTNIGIAIDRDFYEALIAKIIIFRRLEKIYGQGKNSMGQLRSAVIPYSLAIVYSYTDGAIGNKAFDMERVWKNEGLDDTLGNFFYDLMKLVNGLIKHYSTSEDYGENSKKEELWVAIKDCKEVTEFMTSKPSKVMLKKYLITEK